MWVSHLGSGPTSPVRPSSDCSSDILTSKKLWARTSQRSHSWVLRQGNCDITNAYFLKPLSYTAIHLTHASHEPQQMCLFTTPVIFSIVIENPHDRTGEDSRSPSWQYNWMEKQKQVSDLIRPCKQAGIKLSYSQSVTSVKALLFVQLAPSMAFCMKGLLQTNVTMLWQQDLRAFSLDQMKEGSQNWAEWWWPLGVCHSGGVGLLAH